MAHRLIWPLLAIAVFLGFTLALVWRPPPENPGPVTTDADK
jgi:hypothetical protein